MSLTRKLLLLSSSNVHGYAFLEYARNNIETFLNKSNVTEVFFVPYAQPQDCDTYTARIRNVLEPWGFKVTGIHVCDSPADAIASAQAIFVGGGNTFALLKTLYELNLVDLIKRRVMDEGLLYIGSSAGTNVATVNICTTNDMPIVYPPSFEALGLVPFNINPHFLDADEDSTHKGETRECRIGEYLQQAVCYPVLGLREGAILEVDGNKARISGISTAILFKKNEPVTEYKVGDDVSFLLIEVPNKN